MNGRRALKGGRLHVRQQVSTRLISRRHGKEQAGKGRRQMKGTSFVELMCQVTWQITFCGRYRQCNICDISSGEVAGSCAQHYKRTFKTLACRASKRDLITPLLVPKRC